MTIGGRRLVVRRRWLALLSVLWMGSLYGVWELLFAPNGGASLDQAQCAAFEQSSAYADCMRFAAHLATARQADVAQTAVLVAILPVVLLWMLWLAARLLRECRAVECGTRTLA